MYIIYEKKESMYKFISYNKDKIKGPSYSYIHEINEKIRKCAPSTLTFI